jgi:hypothetical protein
MILSLIILPFWFRPWPAAGQACPGCDFETQKSLQIEQVSKHVFPYDRRLAEKLVTRIGKKIARVSIATENSSTIVAAALGNRKLSGAGDGNPNPISR